MARDPFDPMDPVGESDEGEDEDGEDIDLEVPRLDEVRLPRVNPHLGCPVQGLGNRFFTAWGSDRFILY
jgi:hypothetical protein